MLPECKHLTTQVRWRNREINMIGTQCLDCGKAIGQWISHNDLKIPKESLRDWDESIAERYWMLRRAHYKRMNGTGDLF